MGRPEKVIKRFAEISKGFTWDEFVKVMAHFGFNELQTGKTGGSRRKFVDEHKNVISLHKPHPQHIMKRYAIKEALTTLKRLGHKL